MLLLNLLLRHDALLWLIGRLNGRFGFLRHVFVAYPVTQDYADAYTYCWVQRRCRWSPWLAGLYRQDGRVGLMTIISNVEEDFFHPGDPTYNRPHLEALLRRAERFQQLLRAEQLSFAGILPGLLQGLEELAHRPRSPRAARMACSMTSAPRRSGAVRTSRYCRCCRRGRSRGSLRSMRSRGSGGSARRAPDSCRTAAARKK